MVAYGETRVERRSGKNAYEITAEVAEQLFARTGLVPKDIDGIAFTVPQSEAPNPFWSNYASDYLGITPRWCQKTDIGGASAIGNVARAAMAIKAGLCETVMLLHADATSTQNLSRFGCYRNEFWEPVGIQGPPGAFGFLMTRYAAQYNLDYRGLGALAVAQRNGANVNPNAYEPFRKEKISIDTYINSRMVSYPLRLLDSVMPADGGNGLIVTSTANARRRGWTKRAYPIAYREITNFLGAEACPDITETGFSVVGPEALKQAGMKPKDVKMFHPYDDFLIAVMLKLEQFGFCKRGQGSQFLRDTDLSPTGRLPINTGGGQISCGQPGLAGGGLNLTEAVRQMFGEAEGRQVPKPDNAVVTGIGVIPYGRNWGTSNAMVLVR
ncbi:MAG: thiolase family protein [Alphaproteobacteria bacterium]|nr:thiolase family protein [Alphaproteobacteria bacterium]